MILFELFKTHFLFQFRNKQIFIATIFFAIFLVFLFTLAFPSVDKNSSSFFSAVFWISSFFSGNLVLTNLTHLQTHRFNQGVVLTGIDSSVIFFSKLMASLVFMLLIQTVLFIVMNLFFELPSGISITYMLLYSIMGSIGYLSIGTLFFSLAEFQNVKDLMVTILFYPLVVPLFLYLHKGTAIIFELKKPNVLDFILGYDLIFVFLAALLYEFVIEDTL